MYTDRVRAQYIVSIIPNPGHDPLDITLGQNLWYRHCQNCRKTVTAGEWLPAYGYSFVSRLKITTLITPRMFARALPSPRN